jgi:hypothetical protein
LEIGIADPALTRRFVGQPLNVLEQQQPDHETGLDAGAPILAIKWRDLLVDPRPVDLPGKLNQLVLHIDDLVQPRPKEIARTRRLVLLRPHRNSPFEVLRES